jgi:hypothetical protein
MKIYQPYHFISYDDVLSYDDYIFSLGDYIYNIIKPEVNGNLDMFKYILGKYYLEEMMKLM